MVTPPQPYELPPSMPIGVDGVVGAPSPLELHYKNARASLNDKLHLTERLLALVRKTSHLQIPDEQTELIDHLEGQRVALRAGLMELSDAP